jgi:prepilin-type N-terminal cleavage/methylation domain-containing protein
MALEKRTRMWSVRPRGFTLVELLVVIAIIGVLIALTIPAVQKVRDASARLQCLNNLKQVGLAAHQYQVAMKRFPPGMRYQSRTDPNLMSTWLAQILPYLEEESLWTITQDAYRQSRFPFKNPPHQGLATVMGTFACPADGRADQVLFSQKTRTRVAFTSYLGVEGQNLYSCDGILFRDSRVSISDISDGCTAPLKLDHQKPFLKA